MKPPPCCHQVQNLFSKADKDGSGAIDFDEFYKAVDATDDDELDIGNIYDRARRADVKADSMGSMFLLSFLLYPRCTHTPAMPACSPVRHTSAEPSTADARELCA